MLKFKPKEDIEWKYAIRSHGRIWLLTLKPIWHADTHSWGRPLPDPTKDDITKCILDHTVCKDTELEDLREGEIATLEIEEVRVPMYIIKRIEKPEATDAEICE